MSVCLSDNNQYNNNNHQYNNHHQLLRPLLSVPMSDNNQYYNNNNNNNNHNYFGLPLKIFLNFQNCNIQIPDIRSLSDIDFDVEEFNFISQAIARFTSTSDVISKMKGKISNYIRVCLEDALSPENTPSLIKILEENTILEVCSIDIVEENSTCSSSNDRRRRSSSSSSSSRRRRSSNKNLCIYLKLTPKKKKSIN